MSERINISSLRQEHLKSKLLKSDESFYVTKHIERLKEAEDNGYIIDSQIHWEDEDSTDSLFHEWLKFYLNVIKTLTWYKSLVNALAYNAEFGFYSDYQEDSLTEVIESLVALATFAETVDKIEVYKSILMTRSFERHNQNISDIIHKYVDSFDALLDLRDKERKMVTDSYVSNTHKSQEKDARYHQLFMEATKISHKQPNATPLRIAQILINERLAPKNSDGVQYGDKSLEKILRKLGF